MNEKRTLLLGEDITADDVVVDHLGHKFDIVFHQVGNGLATPTGFWGNIVQEYTTEAMALLDEMEMLMVDEYEIPKDSQEEQWLARTRKLIKAWSALHPADD